MQFPILAALIAWHIALHLLASIFVCAASFAWCSSGHHQLTSSLCHPRTLRKNICPFARKSRDPPRRDHVNHQIRIELCLIFSYCSTLTQSGLDICSLWRKIYCRIRFYTLRKYLLYNDWKYSLFLALSLLLGQTQFVDS